MAGHTGRGKSKNVSEPARITLKYCAAPVYVRVALFASAVFMLILFLSSASNFFSKHAGVVQDIVTALMLLFILMLSLFSFFLAKSAGCESILLDNEHVTFPAHLTLVTFADIRFKARYRWEQLRKLALEGRLLADTASMEGDTICLKPLKLVFYFDSGQSVRLTLAHMRPSDIGLLISAVEEHCPGAGVMSSDVQELKGQLSSRMAAIEAGSAACQDSLTACWIKELQEQASIITFSPLPAGTRLRNGSLKTIAQIGSGGFAAIYLAVTTQGRKVVLKESKGQSGTAPGAASRQREFFEREARLLLALDHPGIVKVLDHFIENDRDYLVIEYIEGESLRQLVRRSGPQPVEKVLSWACGIADILCYLHGHAPPILHRDITPDNLILNNAGELFLIDFGAANEFVGTATGTLIGKQAYVAPEQFRGKAQPASDIFGLGATLQFLLTGKDPEALSVSHPRDICPELSSEVDSLVSSCTQPELSERIASADVLVQFIKAAVASK